MTHAKCAAYTAKYAAYTAKCAVPTAKYAAYTAKCAVPTAKYAVPNKVIPKLSPELSTKRCYTMQNVQ